MHAPTTKEIVASRWIFAGIKPLVDKSDTTKTEIQRLVTITSLNISQFSFPIVLSTASSKVELKLSRMVLKTAVISQSSEDGRVKKKRQLSVTTYDAPPKAAAVRRWC